MSVEENTDSQKMPAHQRYYILHREEKLAKNKEKYNLF